jgi:FixJ family two-component response regulator
MNNAQTSVTVVDDDVLVLRSLDRLLQSAGFDVRTFSSASDFLQQRTTSDAGCIVMDLSMPGFSGLDLQHALSDAADERPVIFISGHGSVPSSVEAMKNGAVDFLTKPLDQEKFLAAVRAALQRYAAGHERHAQQAAVSARLTTLTPRESEVLARVVEGRLNKQIAAELGTAEKTIKVHRARMMRKMEVDSLAELVRAWTLTQPPQA